MTARGQRNVVGTLYLIHASGVLGTAGRNSARHYLGWAEPGRLDARIAEHRAGTGARITAAMVRAGFKLEVVWTTPGTRHDERRLKGGGHHDRRCVVCRAGAVVGTSHVDATAALDAAMRRTYPVEISRRNYLIDGDS